ncbi:MULTISPECIES: UDP-N-acetylmuramoyl-L-alanyl-D-glutamate--2,6-diaminopimelate ligase [unclassified Idiomarina]|uniref:UDP-N-acetylmuramoyl-L-alanyl-D-glutamate--2, 6-diaminopimelate ligase n=1 Tax=unclassified Idiomarina TaxID=2614829 RepID=UPI000C93C201|nr:MULTISPECIES: UDP-N-acetylmuramoyl-L-alanyl-D-glutamate--2,6-diaminopimelate ligase [unclassified Idiomarina]MAD52613.1 UDP-N-acetylmuramoyl-L-alanyl-D-glutamate--2,6-diaminopimelate ligase [Idiomarinaceae bacterium]NQZ03313.1 UDP-N-acetylmuramoyl-L-alanyl-D-glutamate--2,6-diaminopimelate ligase [Idiomarina sp.]|tara:strand:- start:5566 stop:7023 length:1458 start_codon:yes stop_codon:yes gene_type:complete
MQLRELLPPLPMPVPNVEVSGIKLDSRQVANGDLFVAVPGYVTDGRDYMDKAITAGARAILAEGPSLRSETKNGVVCLYMPGVKEQLSEIAGRFFHHPSKQATVVGVTGTNGKTSVTHLAAQLAEKLGYRAAVIGTTGSGLIGQLLPEKHTTPDAVTVQQRLSTLVAEGADFIAMEVSSHALVQRRVEALHFEAAVATNISRDHLDYHGSMTHYVDAKRRLFEDFELNHRIINIDDSYLAGWIDGTADVLSISLLGNERAHIRVSELAFAEHGTTFTLSYHGRSAQFATPLLGRFNVYNVVSAVAIMLAQQHSLATVAEHCRTLTPVPGRMEAFQAGDSPLVVVDYAHTPDALQQVLQALRLHCKGKLWCVFGCGGDRDRGKRPQMGQVAAEYADRVVVTDDNPRTEAPQQIIADIMAGIADKRKVHSMEGRRQAVLDTIERAAKDDVVLLAGKGHEDYQVIGQERIDYNERQLVQDWISGVSHD